MYKILTLIGLITLPVLFIASCGGGERATDAVGEAEKKMTSAQNPPADDIDRSNPEWKQNLALPAMFPFEDGKTYYWDLEIFLTHRE